MNSEPLEEKLKQLRIIPVVALPSAGDALPLAEALAGGGLPCAEITFRTEAGQAGLRAIARAFPDFLLGAGTVTTPTEVQQAREAGAQFAVAPGCNPRVLAAAREAGLPFFPGVMTPSDIELALENNARLLKFFPAEMAGGVAMIRAIHAPYKHRGVRFIPTGGINESNLASYLREPSVVAVGGTWILAPLTDRNWDAITRLTRQAVEVVSSL